MSDQFIFGMLDDAGLGENSFLAAGVPSTGSSLRQNTPFYFTQPGVKNTAQFLPESTTTAKKYINGTTFGVYDAITEDFIYGYDANDARFPGTCKVFRKNFKTEETIYVNLDGLVGSEWDMLKLVFVPYDEDHGLLVGPDFQNGRYAIYSIDWVTCTAGLRAKRDFAEDDWNNLYKVSGIASCANSFRVIFTLTDYGPTGGWIEYFMVYNDLDQSFHYVYGPAAASDNYQSSTWVDYGWCDLGNGIVVIQEQNSAEDYNPEAPSCGYLLFINTNTYVLTAIPIARELHDPPQAGDYYYSSSSGGFMAMAPYENELYILVEYYQYYSYGNSVITWNGWIPSVRALRIDSNGVYNLLAEYHAASYFNRAFNLVYSHTHLFVVTNNSAFIEVYDLLAGNRPLFSIIYEEISNFSHTLDEYDESIIYVERKFAGGATGNLAEYRSNDILFWQREDHPARQGYHNAWEYAYWMDEPLVFWNSAPTLRGKSNLYGPQRTSDTPVWSHEYDVSVADWDVEVTGLEEGEYYEIEPGNAYNINKNEVPPAYATFIYVTNNGIGVPSGDSYGYGQLKNEGMRYGGYPAHTYADQYGPTYIGGTWTLGSCRYWIKATETVLAAVGDYWAWYGDNEGTLVINCYPAKLDAYLYEFGMSTPVVGMARTGEQIRLDFTTGTKVTDARSYTIFLQIRYTDGTFSEVTAAYTPSGTLTLTIPWQDNGKQFSKVCVGAYFDQATLQVLRDDVSITVGHLWVPFENNSNFHIPLTKVNQNGLETEIIHDIQAYSLYTYLQQPVWLFQDVIRFDYGNWKQIAYNIIDIELHRSKWFWLGLNKAAHGPPVGSSGASTGDGAEPPAQDFHGAIDGGDTSSIPPVIPPTGEPPTQGDFSYPVILASDSAQVTQDSGGGIDIGVSALEYAQAVSFIAPDLEHGDRAVSVCEYPWILSETATVGVGYPSDENLNIDSGFWDEPEWVDAYDEAAVSLSPAHLYIQATCVVVADAFATFLWDDHLDIPVVEGGIVVVDTGKPQPPPRVSPYRDLATLSNTYNKGVVYIMPASRLIDKTETATASDSASAEVCWVDVAEIVSAGDVPVCEVIGEGSIAPTDAALVIAEVSLYLEPTLQVAESIGATDVPQCQVWSSELAVEVVEQAASSDAVQLLQIVEVSKLEAVEVIDLASLESGLGIALLDPAAVLDLATLVAGDLLLAVGDEASANDVPYLGGPLPLQISETVSVVELASLAMSDLAIEITDAAQVDAEADVASGIQVAIASLVAIEDQVAVCYDDNVAALEPVSVTEEASLAHNLPLSVSEEVAVEDLPSVTGALEVISKEVQETVTASDFARRYTDLAVAIDLPEVAFASLTGMTDEDEATLTDEDSSNLEEDST